MTLISIICPTIEGREHWVERCEIAYEKTISDEFDWEFLLIENQPTCGLAWRAGLKEAEGDYIQLTADDIEPLAGWLEPAIEVVDEGNLPSPLIYEPDREKVQSFGDVWQPPADRLPEDGTEANITRVPFASREQFDRIGLMLPTHYFTDNWVTFRGGDCGFKTLLCSGYALVHHTAPEGRIDWRMRTDREAYERYRTGLMKVQ
jgi:hypothetical protein